MQLVLVKDEIEETLKELPVEIVSLRNNVELQVGYEEKDAARDGGVGCANVSLDPDSEDIDLPISMNPPLVGGPRV